MFYFSRFYQTFYKENLFEAHLLVCFMCLCFINAQTEEQPHQKETACHSFSDAEIATKFGIRIKYLSNQCCHAAERCQQLTDMSKYDHLTLSIKKVCVFSTLSFDQLKTITFYFVVIKSFAPWKNHSFDSYCLCIAIKCYYKKHQSRC